jgi:3-oxo-5alpha-steroid 4-dehydrogenase
LVIDDEMMQRSRQQLREEKLGAFQLVFGVLNDYVNHVRADSVDALAEKCGIPKGALARTVARYNDDAARGEDEMLKKAENKKPLVKAPFYAIDCDLATLAFPTPCITLGGLVTDGLSARVVRESGDPIHGLYAAGRSGRRVVLRGGLSVRRPLLRRAARTQPISDQATTCAGRLAPARWAARGRCVRRSPKPHQVAGSRCSSRTRR